MLSLGQSDPEKPYGARSLMALLSFVVLVFVFTPLNAEEIFANPFQNPLEGTEPVELGGFQWRIESPRSVDLWVEKAGPEGEPALVIRTSPGVENRWVSQPIPVEANKAYLFSAKVRSQLSKSWGQLEVAFLDEKGSIKEVQTSRPIFGKHEWADYEVVALAPIGSRQALLRFAIFGIEGGAGEASLAQPTLKPSVRINISLSTRGNILKSREKAKVTLHLEGTPKDMPLKVSWRLLDFDGKPVEKGDFKSLKAKELTWDLPPLENGYYTLAVEVRGRGLAPAKREVSLGVIEPLSQSARADHPICLDAGMSWSYAPDKERLDTACYICEIAGIRTLRDRLWWGEVEKEEGKINWGRYAQSAEAQAKHHIIVYQIFHDCPPWASLPTASGTPDPHQPPRDPIYIYRLVKRLVQDLGDKIRYFEVWNEPDIFFFYGRPEDYAALLKAAYLGAKDADPTFGILLGSAALPPGTFYERVFENGASDYFDIYNQHYYGAPEDLFHLIPDEVRGRLRRFHLDDKPIWLTEMGMPTRPDEKGNFQGSERQQASYLVRAYVCAFANGISRFFYFYLTEWLDPGWPDGAFIWGIIRSDLSPKPSYVALATLIRQLGEAKCLGWKAIEGGYIVAFRRSPRENVLVVWGKEGATLSLLARGPIVDIVGRKIKAESAKPIQQTIDLSPMPLYIRGVDPAVIQSLALNPTPQVEDWKPTPDPYLEEKRVWLQVGVNPEEPRSGTEDDKWGAYIEPGKPFIVSAWVNNYSDKPARVEIVCQPAPKLTLQGPAKVEIEVGPWERKRHDFQLIDDNLTPGEVLSVTVTMDGEKHKDQGKVYLRSK